MPVVPPRTLAAFAPILAASCAAVQDVDAPPAVPEPRSPEVVVPEPTTGPFAPPAPTEEDSDWVRLTSGEWLRGEIDVLRGETLEFDSEELDDLNLDWSDVAELRTKGVVMIGLTEDRTRIGTLHVDGDRVVVGGVRTEVFRREELLAVVPGEPSERNFWSGSVTLGVTSRSGNTNQTDGSADVRLLRRTTHSRIDMHYNGGYSKVEGVETSNAHRFDGRWDRFLTRRFYVSPLFVQAFRDRFQNIEIRVTPAVGAGYQLVDRGALEWDVEGGLGYQYLRYDSTGPDDSTTQTSTALLLGTNVDTNLTEKVELEALYAAQFTLDGDTGTNQHASVTLSVDLIGELDLDLAVIWDRVGKPVADEDGEVPKKDDFRWQVGFGWSF